MSTSGVRLFVCGDVMLGRGVDQILAHPVDPVLRESAVRDARDYVRLTERRSGAIHRPVDDAWPWGDLLELLDDQEPGARIVNLETAVTTASDFAVGKGVHYRMNPDNIGALSVARPDVCVLANNHVLDFGPAGLSETLDVLDRARLRRAGAGRTGDEALRPAATPLPDGRRVVVVAVGATSSGIPRAWTAGADRPGVALVDPGSPADADAVLSRARSVRRRGDLLVVSIHWGANWGHHLPAEQSRFAHRLVDGGADLVHGHSSHHPRGFEVYRGRLVLYGCGDLVNDYEGISGHAEHRGDLRVAYLPTLDERGRLLELRLAVLRSRRLRLEAAGPADTAWLADQLRRHGGPGSSDLHVAGAGSLVLRPR